MIVITSKKDGFRRAGIAHSEKPTEYADDHFTDEQMRALLAEDKLIVQHVPDGGNIISVGPALEKMEVPELKKLLDDLKVKYPKNADKEKLIELVKANTAEPPKE